MNKLYLLSAFDKSNWYFFTPTPAIFKTKEEAEKFCKLNSNRNIFYTYQLVTVGAMNYKKNTQVKKNT